MELSQMFRKVIAKFLLGEIIEIKTCNAGGYWKAYITLSCLNLIDLNVMRL